MVLRYTIRIRLVLLFFAYSLVVFSVACCVLSCKLYELYGYRSSELLYFCFGLTWIKLVG